MTPILPPPTPQAARCCVPAAPESLRVIPTPAGSWGTIPVPYGASVEATEDRPTMIEKLVA
jgi:hypothetical protein